MYSRYKHIYKKKKHSFTKILPLFNIFSLAVKYHIYASSTNYDDTPIPWYDHKNVAVYKKFYPYSYICASGTKFWHNQENSINKTKIPYLWLNT